MPFLLFLQEICEQCFGVCQILKVSQFTWQSVPKVILAAHTSRFSGWNQGLWARFCRHCCETSGRLRAVRNVRNQKRSYSEKTQSDGKLR